MSEFETIASDWKRLCDSTEYTEHCPFMDDECCSNRSTCALRLLIEPETYKPRIIQWAKDNPKRTYLSDFKEKYPNAPLPENGAPGGICPSRLGLKDDCTSSCIDCWNQEME